MYNSTNEAKENMKINFLLGLNFLLNFVKSVFAKKYPNIPYPTMYSKELFHCRDLFL